MRVVPTWLLLLLFSIFGNVSGSFSEMVSNLSNFVGSLSLGFGRQTLPPGPSKRTDLPNFPNREHATLYPRLVNVERMTLRHVAEILQLCYSPTDEINTKFDRKNLIQAIVKNFCSGNFKPLKPDRIESRKSRGYLFPKYNRKILTAIELDSRIASFLGFYGCIDIFAKCFKGFESLKVLPRPDETKPEPLKAVVSSLEDFFIFTLRNTIEPYSFSSSDGLNGLENERLYYLNIYQNMMLMLPFDLVIKAGNQGIHFAIIDTFSPYFHDKDFFEYFEVLKGHIRFAQYILFQKAIAHLVGSAGVSAFCAKELMGTQYRIFNDIPVLLSKKKASLRSYYLTLYCEMIPVLRALTLKDKIREIAAYLSSFRSYSNVHSFAKDHLTDILRVVNSYVWVSDFVLKAQRRPQLAEDILTLLDKTFSWDRLVALKLAVQNGFNCVVEAFLMFTQLSEGYCANLITKAVANLRPCHLLPMLTLLIGYCSWLDTEELQALAKSFISSKPDQPNPDQDMESRKHRNGIIATIFLTQAAALTEITVPLPSIFAVDAGNKIPLPCPLVILDPALIAFEPYESAEAVDELLPKADLLHLAQLLLLRMFKMPYSFTMFTDDSDEAFDWREAIGFMNLMVEKLASAYNDKLPVVKFYDPIDRHLSKANCDPTSYAIRYREIAISFPLFPLLEESRSDSDSESEIDFVPLGSGSDDEFIYVSAKLNGKGTNHVS